MMWQEPWPETAGEWEYYATISQMRVDRRRQMEREARQEFRRTVRCDLKAGAVIFGIMGVIAACWLAAWWLFALVSA